MLLPTSDYLFAKCSLYRTYIATPCFPLPTFPKNKNKVQ